ncbi:hypothetical protein OGAPHI_002587 [Ogataea philodendri]|uniref:RlpA-like protein double-psi beta-barrel domain-containing protein n=2 Tax=Saccharomycotina TaxID=147537 RepID=A0A9P8PCM2_9ASCO|nr:uncharacterized protein OGAPHI_002587 [Ogataea philodendri]KAH3668832.1 hypothetical protein OGAPHI_002587 [Ogataea philodendri]
MRAFSMSPTKTSYAEPTRQRSVAEKTRFIVNSQKKTDSSFQYLLDNVKTSTNGVLKKNFSAGSKGRYEALIESGILEKNVAAVTLRYGDNSVTTEFCTLFFSVLKSYELYQDTSEQYCQQITKSLEVFVSGLHGAPESKLLKCSIQLVVSVLQTYINFPQLAEEWFKIRGDKSLREISALYRKRFPTFDFVHKYVNSTVSPPSNDAFTLQYRDILLSSLMKIIDGIQPVREYFLESKLCETLLKYPLSLREQENENRLKRDPVKNKITTEQFNQTVEFQIYTACLVYYIDIMDLSRHEDTVNQFLMVLSDFFENLLVYFNINKNSTIVSIFFEGFKTVAAHSELNYTLIKSFAENPLFTSLLWSGLLCFKETELTASIERAASRITHKYTLDFIKFIYTSNTSALDGLVHTKAPDFGSKETQWYLVNVSQLYSIEKDTQLIATKMKQCFDDVVHSQPTKREKCLNENSVFYQLLIVRLNTFFLYDATENKQFLAFLIHLVVVLGGTPLENEASPLILALKNLYLTSQLVSTNKKKLLSIDPENLYFPYQDIPTLSTLPDLKHWLYDQKINSLKMNNVAKMFPQNRLLLKRFALDLNLDGRASQVLEYIGDKFHTAVDISDVDWITSANNGSPDVATTAADDEYYPTTTADDYYPTNTADDCSSDDDVESYPTTTGEKEATSTTSNTSSDATSSVAEVTTTSAPAATSTASSTTSTEETTSSSTTSSTSSATGTNTGRGTFYEVGADNCGTSSTDSDLVCAIAHSLYETEIGSDDISSYCGRSITAHYNGNSVTVRVVDSCESCGDNDLDFSPTAFQKLADPDLGEIQITWSWD